MITNVPQIETSLASVSQELRSQNEIIEPWNSGWGKPLISIICNTYNHESYIKDTLNGFLIQKTDFPFEILIHDDASTDNTAGIIREYESRYPRIIKPIYQTKNQFSQGIKISATFQYPRVKGDYIAFCEGDDYWISKEKLQKQAQFLIDNEKYSHCWHRFCTLEQSTKVHKPDLNGRYFFDKAKGVDFGFDKFCHTGWHIGMQTIMHRKSAVNFQNVFKPLYRDVFLIADLLSAGKGYCFSDVMAVYRIHADGIYSSADSYSRAKTAVKVYEAVAKAYPQNKDLLFKYQKFSDSFISMAANSGNLKESTEEIFNRMKMTSNPLSFAKLSLILLKNWIIRKSILN